MKGKLTIRLWSAFFLTAVLVLPLSNGFSAQQDQVAAFKQSLAQNQKRLAQYRWVETTTVSVKGDEKSQVLKQCFYGPDGKVQKQQISAPAEQESKRGIRGRIIAKKKEEMTDYMKQAAALIHEYVPPDSERIQAAKDSGKIKSTPGQGSLRMDFRDFVKPGDTLSITLNTGDLSIQKIDVNSYLDSPSDVVTLAVTFATLNDGTSYAANSVLNAPSRKIQVVVQNASYQKVVAATQPRQHVVRLYLCQAS
jgi:hypothetical protein